MISIPTDILSLSTEPIAIGAAGRLVFANSAAEAILGAGCVGKSVAELFGPEIAQAQASSFAVSLPLGRQYHSVRVCRAEGHQLFFLSPPTEQPAPINEAFFLSMRGCLMNVGLAAEKARLRLDALGDPELSASLASMTQQYFAILRLTENSSAVCQLGSGAMPFALSCFDLDQMCRSLAESLQFLRPDLSLRVHSAGPLLVWADQRLMENALLNLLSNALIHGETVSRIDLGLMQTREHVLLSLSDNGRGIPPQELGGVFHRYLRGADGSGPSRGAGLGLTVVRGIAELHQGTLLLESRPGSGTAVRLSLSKKLGAGRALCAPESDYCCPAQTLLKGLAGCLPASCYSECYLD